MNIPDDDQFTRRTAKPQDNILSLVNMVLTTTWHTFICRFHQQADAIAIRGQISSTTAEIYI